MYIFMLAGLDTPLDASLSGTSGHPQVLRTAGLLLEVWLQTSLGATAPAGSQKLQAMPTQATTDCCSDYRDSELKAPTRTGRRMGCTWQLALTATRTVILSPLPPYSLGTGAVSRVARGYPRGDRTVHQCLPSSVCCRGLRPGGLDSNPGRGCCCCRSLINLCRMSSHAASFDDDDDDDDLLLCSLHTSSHRDAHAAHTQDSSQCICMACSA
jgi:hypothetical protein